jgi:hypothetical protein
MLAAFQFGCTPGNSQLRATLDDAILRHASIDERVKDWGAATAKETLSDGQLVYTWKFPWSEQQMMPDMTAYPIQHMCTVMITSSADNAIQSYQTDDC